MGKSGLEILAYESSPIGMICLRQRVMPSDPDTVVTEITLDHEFLMSSHNTASERALSVRALEAHAGKDLTVLIGGLGLGYTAREALTSDRVGRVEVVEYLPQVIDWLDRGLLPLAGELKADSRLTVTQGDVYARLSGPPGSVYDLILIDVDHSPDEPLGEASAAFYTRHGLSQAREHLAQEGILGVWSYAKSTGFAETLRAVFAEVQVEPLTFWNPVLEEEETNWLFFSRR